jgi:hypothetical protein
MKRLKFIKNGNRWYLICRKILIPVISMTKSVGLERPVSIKCGQGNEIYDIDVSEKTKLIFES